MEFTVVHWFSVPLTYGVHSGPLVQCTTHLWSPQWSTGSVYHSHIQITGLMYRSPIWAFDSVFHSPIQSTGSVYTILMYHSPIWFFFGYWFNVSLTYLIFLGWLVQCITHLFVWGFFLVTISMYHSPIWFFLVTASMYTHLFDFFFVTGSMYHSLIWFLFW